MKKYSIVVCLVLLLLLSFRMESKPSALQGRHYFVGFMQNEISLDTNTNFTQSIFISTIRSDTITINVPGQPLEKRYLLAGQIYEVKVGDTFELKLDSNIVLQNGGVFQNKLIEISADCPISVWVYSSENQSSDGYMAIPCASYGREYRVISLGNDFYSGERRLINNGSKDSTGNIINQKKYEESLTPRSGEFLVMASWDSTEIEYILTADTRNGLRKGDTGRVMLNMGECLLVQGAEGDIGTNDLTGTLVRGNNPFGVISGHTRTAVLQGIDYPYDTKDHIAEMLPPTYAFGKQYISVPFIDAEYLYYYDYHNLCYTGDLLRAVTNSDSTTIRYYKLVDTADVEEHIAFIENAGDFLEIMSNKPVYWESDKPIMLCQYMTHTGEKRNEVTNESINYDPSLVVLAPLEQQIDEVSFSSPSNNKIFSQYVAHCVVVIAEENAINYITLDGRTITTSNPDVWNKPLPNSNYRWGLQKVSSGQHKLKTDRGNFVGLVYGHGLRDSYAMMLGSRLSDPNVVDTIPPSISSAVNCGEYNISIQDNETGIAFCYINNAQNFSIEKTALTDTTTHIHISAVPIDRSQFGEFEVEVVDKESNTIRQRFIYPGFRFVYPKIHDMGMLSVVNATIDTLKLYNVGDGIVTLTDIVQPTDTRLAVSAIYGLNQSVHPNTDLTLCLNFNPTTSLEPLNTIFYVVFDCDTIEIRVIGDFTESPRLVAADINFGKVRVFDEKEGVGEVRNTGNMDAIINSLDFEVMDTNFSIEDLAETALGTDRSISVNAKFSPASLGNKEAEIIVRNNLSVGCSFTMIGLGAAPNIPDVVLDYGKQRLGTYLDTVLTLTNTGNYNDTINYVGPKSTTHSEDTSMWQIEEISDVYLDEDESKEFAFSFLPIDTIAMENVFTLRSAWSGHKDINVTIKGQGTLPVIEVYGCRFDTTAIFATKIEEHILLKSLGNEALTVDSIRIIEGDMNSFVMNFTDGLIFQPNSNYTLPIRFTPHRTGEHYVLLEITSDAMPNYERKKDTVMISGFCTTENNDLKVTLSLDTLQACNADTSNLVISNNSTGKILLDSILLKTQFGNVDVAFLDELSNILPYELNDNEGLTLPLSVYAEKLSDSLQIIVYYNDGNSIEVVEKIVARVDTIRADLTATDVTNLLPNDTFNIYGVVAITDKSEGASNISISLSVRNKMFYLLDSNCVLEEISGGNSENANANVQQIGDEIILDAVDIQNGISDSLILKFVISLKVLLARDKVDTISITAYSDRCYELGTASVEVQVGEVCADQIRQLGFDGFEYMFVMPNVVNDVLDVTLNIFEEGEGRFVITDVLGREVIDFPEIRYHKGRYKYMLNFSEKEKLQSGIYFLTFFTNTLRFTEKIVILN